MFSNCIKVICLAAMIYSGNIFAAQKIGVTAALRGEVVRVASADKTTPLGVLSSGSVIYLGDEIKVAKDGRLQVLLLDETVFTLGSGAEMTIDKFVYNPNKGAGELVSNITKGAFRFISGKVAKQNKDAMKVKIPSGIIGVRGTQVAGEIRNDGSSSIILVGPGLNNLGVATGAITLTNNQGSVEISRPGYMTTISQNTPPSTPEIASPEQIQEIESQTQEDAEVQIAQELQVDSIENVAATDNDGDGFPDQVEANTELGETVAVASSSNNEGESLAVVVIEAIVAENQTTQEDNNTTETQTESTATDTQVATDEVQETTNEETEVAETEVIETQVAETEVIETQVAETEVIETQVADTLSNNDNISNINDNISNISPQAATNITSAIAEGVSVATIVPANESNFFKGFTGLDTSETNLLVTGLDTGLDIRGATNGITTFLPSQTFDAFTASDTFEDSLIDTYTFSEFESYISGIDIVSSTPTSVYLGHSTINDFTSVLTGSSVFTGSDITVSCSNSSDSSCGGTYDFTDTWNFANNTYRSQLNTNSSGINIDTDGRGLLNANLNFSIDKTVDLASMFIIADDSQDAKVYMSQTFNNDMSLIGAGDNYGDQTEMWIGNTKGYNHDSAWMSTVAASDNLSSVSTNSTDKVIVQSVGWIDNYQKDGTNGIGNMGSHELVIYTSSDTSNSNNNTEIARGSSLNIEPQ